MIEQVGTYDPMPNEKNEKLVTFNFERIRHWIGKGAHISDPVAELLGTCGIIYGFLHLIVISIILLGLSGFYPIHPRTYMSAWRNRALEEAESAANAAREKVASAAGAETAANP